MQELKGFMKLTITDKHCETMDISDNRLFVTPEHIAGMHSSTEGTCILIAGHGMSYDVKESLDKVLDVIKGYNKMIDDMRG
jgi:uncharacterized protein YlzI (FlbEa/FlbD family)